MVDGFRKQGDQEQQKMVIEDVKEAEEKSGHLQKHR